MKWKAKQVNRVHWDEVRNKKSQSFITLRQVFTDVFILMPKHGVYDDLCHQIFVE